MIYTVKYETGEKEEIVADGFIEGTNLINFYKNIDGVSITIWATNVNNVVDIYCQEKD